MLNEGKLMIKFTLSSWGAFIFVNCEKIIRWKFMIKIAFVHKKPYDYNMEPFSKLYKNSVKNAKEAGIIW